MIKPLPREAVEHAESEYPRESCGVIVGGEYFPCRNIAKSPDDHFVICPKDYKAALRTGDIEAIVHSHPDYPATASEADLKSCEDSALPWAIIPVMKGVADEAAWYFPSGDDAPLVGRKFIHGVHDCLSIILDYYRRERGIDFGSFDREDGWWNTGKDYYRELLPKAGFVEVDSPQQGDVILMKIKSPVPNHAGIYLEDGIIQTEPHLHPSPMCLLHHMYNQDSRRDPYGGYWLEKTVSIWRHETENS